MVYFWCICSDTFVNLRILSLHDKQQLKAMEYTTLFEIYVFVVTIFLPQEWNGYQPRAAMKVAREQEGTLLLLWLGRWVSRYQ